MHDTVDAVLAENDDGILETPPTLKERLQGLLERRRVRRGLPLQLLLIFLNFPANAPVLFQFCCRHFSPPFLIRFFCAEVFRPERLTSDI